ncbi:MAG: SdrD B-like domain-containing protein [Candidatus Altimarinota bacterium]
MNLAISEDFNDADWSYQPPATASIGNLVWDDLDGDGLLDGGEPGIANVTLDLYWDLNNDGDIDGGDVLLNTQTTDGSGNYDFINLMPRSYLVKVTDTNLALSGFAQTGGVDPTAIEDLAIGEDYNDANFGYQNQSGQISGAVWNDVDRSVSSTVGDIGIENVSVDLIVDTNLNGVFDSGEPIFGTVLTNASGAFQFTNLIAGSYLIRVNDLNGTLSFQSQSLQFSLQQTNPRSVQLNAGELLSGNDFFYASSGGRRHRTPSPEDFPEAPEPEPEPEIIPEPEPNIYMEEELKQAAPLSSCEGLHEGVKENLAQVFDGEGCNVHAENLCSADPLMFPLLSDEACLELVPDRDLEFGDVDSDDEAYAYIQTLKNTRIIEAGDYIASGDGNHSTGKQQRKFQRGEWEYQPDRLVKRVEVLKTALVANCIPVEDQVPVPANGFRFKDIPVDPDPNDEVLSFTARVFYTAYKHGVVVGYEDQYARPYEAAKISEILAFLLRAAHAIPDDYDVLDGAWYQRYLLFAMNNDLLVNLSHNPADEMTRRDFAKLIIRSMAYNPDPKIHGYIERVNMSEQIYSPEYPTHRPVPDVKAYLIKPDQCREEVESCLIHDPERKLRFSDVRKNTFAADFIDMLRTTKIIPEGDYIASGHGNASTGRQQEKFQSGRWQFQPNRLSTRLEVLKMALVANCISIPDEIPVPEDGFRFRDLPPNIDPKNEGDYFIARVMYTGYINGIITPDRRRMANALDPITRIEALTILIRSAKALDGVDRSEKPLPFKDVDQTQWYAKFIEFAYEMGIISGEGDGYFRPKRELQRSEVAKLLIQFMGLSRETGIRTYVSELFDYYGLQQKRVVVEQEEE